jgi:hypothetical protein
MKKTLILFSALLMLFTVVLFNGCGKDNGTNSEYPDVTADSYTITDTLKYKQTDTAGINIVDWPYGAATLNAIIGDSIVIASAAINADGSFVLVLPASVPGKYLSSLTAEAIWEGGSVVADPETVRYMDSIRYVVDLVINGLSYKMVVGLCLLKSDLTVEEAYSFNFYDLPGTFIGIGSSGTHYAWSFTKGWSIIGVGTIFNTSVYSSSWDKALPAEAIWVN